MKRFVHVFVALCALWPSGPAFSDSGVARPDEGGLAIARLERDGRAYCRATLLDARLALTAAHCVQDPNREGPAAGAVLEFPDGSRVGVVAVATIPDFRYGSHAAAPLSTINRDVAIVELESDVAIAPINLYRFDPDEDGWVFVPRSGGRWERCATRSLPGGDVFWAGCSGAPGESGTPALRVESGSLNAVGVVVAQSHDGGLFVHAVGPKLPELLWARPTKEIVSP